MAKKRRTTLNRKKPRNKKLGNVFKFREIGSSLDIVVLIIISVIATAFTFHTLFIAEAGSPAARTRNRIIKTAHAELGTTENPPGSNRVKYNGSSDRQFWCNNFISWVHLKAGVPFYATQNEGGWDGGWRISYTGNMKAYLENHGTYVTSNPNNPPRRGDIFYKTRSGGGHTGIVRTVKDGKILTIDGNSSDRVKYNWRTFGSIHGYGRPHSVYITKRDTRRITDVTLHTHFKIDGHWHYDYEKINNFNRHLTTVRLSGQNGSWNGSMYRGDFIKTIKRDRSTPGRIHIRRDDLRNITLLKVHMTFKINGQWHYDWYNISHWDEIRQLKLDGRRGKWDSNNNRWVGNFLRHE